MKNKFSNGRLSYFSAPRMHGNVLAWLKPESESKQIESLVEDTLRWADDGGKMLDLGSRKDRSNPDAPRERASE